jgi:alkanesulfonate monooxygenase SsuD/methylene tetrahydromethanopterin reductase-like flavin-dependent oxidoreductase (luciferase family)
MRFGTFFFFQAAPGLSHAEVVHRELEQMEWTEELGFDQIWLTEHHFIDYGLAVDPASLAATAASRTRRVRIGLAAAILPFHHPLRLAEQLALIDIISKGRLDVGVGRGNRPAEFRGYHVPQQENRERFDEAVDIMLRAWTEERFSHEGRFFTIGEARLIPKPWQRPHPPIYQVCGSDDGIESSAARGSPMLNSILTGPVSQLVKRRDSYVTALRKHGRGDAEIAALMKDWGVSRQIYVAPTDAQALARGQGRRDVVPGLAAALPGPRAHRGYAPESPARLPGRRRALRQGDVGRAGRGDPRLRLPGHGDPQARGDARHGRGAPPLLDELRRPPPGQDPPLHGAVRARGHAAPALSARAPTRSAAPR